MRTLQRTVAVGLCLTVVLGLATCVQAQPMKAVSEADLLTLIRVGIAEEAIVAKLDRAGVDFPVNDEALERLKKAGASPGVLEAVKRLAAKKPADGPERKLMIWTHRHYKSYDNPLPCEVCINGEKVATFKSEVQRDVEKFFKPGWNVITLRTKPEVPANDSNGLTLDIGPAYKDPQTDDLVMERIYWSFRNTNDWKFKDGHFTHDLGPDVKEVTLSTAVFYAGPVPETEKVKEGDFVLSTNHGYAQYNSSVSATVYVNGTPLNSIVLSNRQLCISKLLRKGENEIKLITRPVANYLDNNDTTIRIDGPAEWSVVKGAYQLAPVVEFKCMEGWQRDKKTGQLVNKEKRDAETVERVIKFTLDQAPKVK